MPLIRTFAKQGHAVPNGYQRPLGPFPAEVLAQNPRAYGEQPHADSLHEAFDDVRMFRCRICTDILAEHELAEHICDTED